jgi:hypothetical protein
MQTAVSNINALPRRPAFFIKFLISVVLFLSSGFLSSYLYYRFQNRGGVYFPGLLYTSSTILVFLLTKKIFTIKNLLIYYILMNLTYLVIWFLTMLSSWYASLGGIFIAGTGAVITFALVNKFVTAIKFSKANVFFAGGLAFLITDILYFSFSGRFEKTPAEYIFKIDSSPGVLFFEVFVFWHTLVGAKLFLTLHRFSGTAGHKN